MRNLPARYERPAPAAMTIQAITATVKLPCFRSRLLIVIMARHGREKFMTYEVAYTACFSLMIPNLRRSIADRKGIMMRRKFSIMG